MNIQNANTESSGSSNNSFLPLKKRTRPLSDETNDFHVVTKKRRSGLKYKGIVRQHNGHWGAQIYIDLKRIWIGTFKSDLEAASAYDSVSIKLKKTDANSQRNIPCSSDFMVQESEFQEGYTTEGVLNMIKDGSYPYKLREFLNNRSQFVKNMDTKGTKWTQLFQKELTPSDVGKLNRLVIPKKYAVRYLPYISVDKEEREEGEIVEDMEEIEVVFYDKEMRQWTFKYCYWSSSKSFVLTRGWIGFVKEKKLKEKDVVVFYTCENFLMIDVQYFSENGSVVITEEVNKMVNEVSGPIVSKTGNVVGSKLEDEETKSKEKKGGFMLFGVLIK